MMGMAMTAWDRDSVICGKCKIRYSLSVLKENKKYIAGHCPKCGGFLKKLPKRSYRKIPKWRNDRDGRGNKDF
jgi:PHP family Zn ribbon phosphoesterase